MKLTTTALAAIAALSIVACADEDVTTGDEQNATEEGLSIDSKAKSGGEVEVWRSIEDDQYYFHLQAKNGELVLSSEGYETLDGALNATRSLKTAGAGKTSFTLKKSSAKKAKWYFVVKAGNGEIIGRGETYDTKTKAITGAKTAQALLRGATKVDLWTDQCGFEMYVGGDDEIRFRLRAENGEPILMSEGYSSEKAAKTAIDTVVTTSLIAEGDWSDGAAYSIFKGDDNQYYWNLVAGNNEIVASGGEGFSTSAAARDSIELVKSHANEEAACWTVDAPKPLTGAGQ